MSTKHFNKSKEIEDFFEERVDKLAQHLSRFQDEAVSLHGNLDRNPHKEEFYVSLNVRLPSATLYSKETAADLFIAINSAFNAIIRQAEKVKTKIRQKDRKRGGKQLF
ncbi:MAG: ribosome-associated translation inhibitor RaiA [Candidatus Omnitrophica bacterium]|nr:ribosome-associated translation inhibitor RaiA [Candidatus Omnitrophota bacterium]